MNKPDVDTENEVDALCQSLLLHPMNLPTIKKIAVESIQELIEDRIKQAKRETAEKIFERIEKLPLGLSRHSMRLDHYDEKGNEVLVHQLNCLKCKYERVKTEFLEKKEQEIPEED